jgi:hypothetical protein
MKRNEFLFVVVLISLAAGLMSNVIRLPAQVDNLLNSAITKTILVIFTLYGFSISPAVGLSAVLLTAIIIFQHNVSFVNNLQTSNPLYNNSFSSFVRNLFTPTTVNANLMHNETAEYAEMIDNHPAEGSYPSDETRPSNYESSLEYDYRPQEDSGSDEFSRFGPNIDEKLEVLHE